MDIICKYCEGTGTMIIGSFLGPKEVTCFCQTISLVDSLEKMLFILEISTYKNTGLCYYAMNYGDSAAKIGLVLSFIQENRPKWYQRFYNYSYRHMDYYWPTEDKKVRIKFLKYHIKRLKKKLP